MSRPDSVALILGVGLLLSGRALAQSPGTLSDKATSEPPAVVRSVKISTTAGYEAVEIISTRPLIPSVTPLENPARLVIDLENAVVTAPARIPSHGGQISAVRVRQFQKNPPVTRIVMDLEHTAPYNWDEAGNRLVVRLEPPANPKAAQPSAPALASTSEGHVELASLREKLPVSGNSLVHADMDPALLRLPHGGQVRVCSGTSVSLSAASNGRDSVLGMNTGALETHYEMDASTNAVMTPDFRIMPSGEGQFYYAISADSRGNTCVRALPGNTASAIVSELMGDGVYEVKPFEQAVFRQGSVGAPENVVPSDCGCEEESDQVLRASATTPAWAGQPAAAPANAMPISRTSPETAALPPSQAKETHVQVDVPFVFRASENPPPAPKREAGDHVAESQAQPDLLDITVRPAGVPEVPPPQPVRRSVLGKVKDFFAGLFR